VLAVVADMAVFAFFEDHGFRPAFNMSTPPCSPSECSAAWLSGKSSFLSVSFPGTSSGRDGTQKDRQQPGSTEHINVDSDVFAGGPPVPVGAQKMLRFVDTSQVTIGPQHSPRYWTSTGARLDIGKRRILLHIKFWLLAPISYQWCSFNPNLVQLFAAKK
jgi:hypothetical protein